MLIPDVCASTVAYAGKLITVQVDKLSKDGGIPFTREVAVTTDSVAVLALDQHQRVLLIKQYRHPVKAPVWEIPAGRIDIANEPPEQTALRELREETDIVAKHIQPLTIFGNSVGWTTEKTHVFLAQDLENVSEYERQHEEADIEKKWVSLSTAQGMVLDGSINDAKTIIGILLALSAVA